MRNIELLELNEESTSAIIKKMRKYSNSYGLLFKIIAASETEVCISVSQINPDSKKIFDQEELVEIAHDVFEENLIPGQQLKITANTIVAAPTKVVDVDWIKRRMYQSSTKLKQMAKDLGFPKNGLDDYFGGNRPFTKVEKAMFYYYLEYRMLMKETGTQNGENEEDEKDS